MEEHLHTQAVFEALQCQHPTVIPKGFGFQCDRGWVDILDRFFCDLEKLLPMEVDFRLRQVKEKLAGLRIYYHATDISSDLTWDICRLVELAEIRSFRTCESCGRPGGIWNRHGFYLTACERCASKRSEGYSAKAVPVPRDGPSMVKLRDGWFRYDETLDDLVLSDPPGGMGGSVTSKSPGHELGDRLWVHQGFTEFLKAELSEPPLEMPPTYQPEQRSSP